MAWGSLHRNYTLSTTKGHSITFKKGERTWIPPIIVQDAMAIGVILEEQVEVLAAEAARSEAMSDDKRREQVFAAFEKLMLRNNRGDFTASGLPHPKKMAEFINFEIGEKLRDDLWKQYNQMKSDEAEAERTK